MSQRSKFHRSGRQRGFILVIGLLFMLVLMLLSASMFRSFTMQQKIAGNTLDKQRSFEAAQSAVQYGENWLFGGNATTAVACSGNLSSLMVCSNAISWALTDTWPTSYSYALAGLNVGSNVGAGGLAANGDINYVAAPNLYINYVNLTSDGKGTLYQVTAIGTGGSLETRSVIQSTYQLESKTKDLTGP